MGKSNFEIYRYLYGIMQYSEGKVTEDWFDSGIGNLFNC